MQNPTQEFLHRLQASFENGSFVKLTLGHPANRDAAIRRLIARPVEIRGEKRCSLVSRFKTRDETKNFTFPEALALVRASLERDFLSGALFTETEETQLELDRKPRLRTTPTTRPPADLSHDRSKDRWVDPAARYLTSLGVTDSTGKVRERMGDKFRQIERFVDLLASAFRESSLPGAARPISACDMGAGKGYLTFAAYEYLRRVEHADLTMTGVEARGELATLCNRVAMECGFDGLRFQEGTIEAFPVPALDILIALHACDTATDDALAAGIRTGASLILAAPCCHKQIRPQVDAAAGNSPLRDVLRHGVFAERHAEIATDALRVLLLERAGYRVRVAEFIAAEHTAKNVIILATRRPNIAGPAIVEETNLRIAALKQFYGIRQHRLEDLLVE